MACTSSAQMVPSPRRTQTNPGVAGAPRRGVHADDRSLSSSELQVAEQAIPGIQVTQLSRKTAQASVAMNKHKPRSTLWAAQIAGH